MSTDTTKPSPSNPRIKRILMSYQETAERSLNGPSDAAVRDGGVYRGPAAPDGCRGPAGQRTVSRASTPSKGPCKRSGPALVYGGDERKEAAMKESPRKCEIVQTNLEGQGIACFEVGGEQRLCMPQILSTVLRDFNPDQVFEVCAELHIFFSRCDPEQLESLKEASILPHHVTTCGLITYTNAERMCSTLLRNQEAYKCRLPVVVEGLKVYHECFGGCKGIFVPDALSYPQAQCVQCAECGAMFAPSQFVSHSHSELENGTIHWGFDPANWKAYLMLSLDQTGYPGAQELLDSLKTKFKDVEEKVSIKQEVDDGAPVKKTRYAESAEDSVKRKSAKPRWLPADVSGAWKFCVLLCKQLDAAKIRSGSKLPPFLNKEEPFLADTESIVSYAESQWSDRNFAPNVSLDPVPYKNLHDLYDGDDDYCDEKVSPVDDSEVVTRSSSNKWTSPVTSTGYSTVLLSADSGNVSDDDSDETESVLSDKLPAINESEADSRDRISDAWNARLGLLIRALEGELRRSAGGHDPVQDFLQLQKQHSEIVTSLAETNGTLSQRRVYLWSLMEEKLRAVDEMRRTQDEELISLKQKTALKMRRTMRDRCRLVDQIEKLTNGSNDSDLMILVMKYREEAEVLRRKLQSAEEMNASLRREISDLHGAIDQFTQPPQEDGGLVYAPLVIKREIGSTVEAPGGVRPPPQRQSVARVSAENTPTPPDY